MAFTMHSHSGQFCPGHATGQLEAVVQQAIALSMRLISVTEHMPRTHDQDLYPEELEAGDTSAMLLPRHEEFLTEGIRLRDKYEGQIQILIGFEGEWIRPTYGPIIRGLAKDPRVDFYVGSVHHVHGIPIDFDRAMYEDARKVGGGGDQKLFEDYFDAMLAMLQDLRPRVIAHFDLIRLFSDAPNQDLKTWNSVWARIVQCLKLIVYQGGLLEVNSSALRKGLHEPYPSRSICEEFLSLGGKFTLSDDSHAVAQVGLNYIKVQKFLQDVGVETLWYLERLSEEAAKTCVVGSLRIKSVLLTELDMRAYPTSTPDVR
ncbi:histidinolphosphatase [Pseudogymnoascus destructans]|uniref:Histidinol-phosphatase n=2 Tax=Pseudogymnoascus destructans TaxID=655981 RepID=L8G1J6_PSED2|nr:histidinolphosphatase [Pseudogymnoascus destructans]ELR07012.1 hypothetical protein GMDG_02334 [Pseudogymnoascus destructans 20631-21]OAF56362.1 histidinolphosphatase [Pseudogymnoascus destructans]